jgi:hypothetical protein
MLNRGWSPQQRAAHARQALDGGTPLGANPAARVHRGPGQMSWRSGPSKIRDPRTGLLLDPPSAAGGTGGAPYVTGDRCRSTRFFKQRALELLARDDLLPRDRARLLELNRMACKAFMTATVAGVLDQAVDIKLSPKRKAKRIPGTVMRAIDFHAREIEKLTRWP